MSIDDLLTTANQRRVVLVADDEEAILNLTARVIASLGLIPLMASDGAAALEFVRTCRALLVCAILDVQMPILNGVEAAHAIQAHAPHLAIVLMSGDIPASLADHMNQLHGITMLYKPFPISTLREVVMQIIGNGNSAHIDTEYVTYNARIDMNGYGQDRDRHAAASSVVLPRSADASIDIRQEVTNDSLAAKLPDNQQTYEMYEFVFRRHHATNSARRRGRYENYRLVYRYGYELGADARYASAQWANVEHDARPRWEDRNPGTWDEFKDIIQYAWNVCRNRQRD